MATPRTILVKAGPLADPALLGKARVAYEDTTTRYIEEGAPVEVPVTAYYLRKLRTGELIQVASKDELPL